MDKNKWLDMDFNWEAVIHVLVLSEVVVTMKAY